MWLYIALIAIIVWLIFSRARPPPIRTKPYSNYNSLLYSALVDPLIVSLHGFIARQILDSNARIFDACCGTGQLAFKLSSKSKEVVGIDLSPKMISHANKQKQRRKATNVTFVFGDVTEILKTFESKSFDYGTISMALHEMPKIFRAPMIKEMARVAKEVIIADYASDMPVNRSGVRNRILEFMAGGEHFANFRDFRHNGGLINLIQDADLEIKHKQLIDNNTLMVLRVTQKQKAD